ncbi:hypothetical protein [Alicyclobacillus dauci]|uniref:Uncharacterized protein n=1 Tax=Alicyclobacillus dauci TaxID=1475485 RepID=A0ABY6YZU0_9BACL|nr:hypothetical protein [Alicyclobacillus dauci]WAH35977.1 hypothetical protein NZD86_17165 [Alicyclobacillus dauci]
MNSCAVPTLGVSSIGGLSFFVGPWLGGVILHASSGAVLFLVAAGFSFLATPMIERLIKFACRGKVNVSKRRAQCIDFGTSRRA